MAAIYSIHRDVNLSKDPTKEGRIPSIVLRRGEGQLTEIVGHLKKDGMPFDATGFAASFRAYNGAGEWIVAEAKVNRDTVTYTVDTDLTAVVGDVCIAHFSLAKDGGDITSDDMPIYVINSVDMSDQEAEKRRNQIDVLTEELIGYRDTMKKATDNANTAAAAARGASSSASQSATLANTAAERATKAAEVASGNASSASSAADRANAAASKVDDAMALYKTLKSSDVTYQVGDSPTVPPAGAWSATVTEAPQGKYLWTRTVLTYTDGDGGNKGTDIIYTSTYQGMDGDFNGEERLAGLEFQIDPSDNGINLRVRQ